jgi:hypothetical protein
MKKVTLLSIMLLIAFSGYSQLSPNRSSYKYTLKKKNLVGKDTVGKYVNFNYVPPTSNKKASDNLDARDKTLFTKSDGSRKKAFHHAQRTDKVVNKDELLIRRKNFMLIQKFNPNGTLLAADYELNQAVKPATFLYTKNHYFGWDKMKANVTLDKGRLLVDILRPVDTLVFDSTVSPLNSTFDTSRQIKSKNMLYEIDLLRENIRQPMRVIRLPFTATTWSAGIIAARYRIPKKGTGYPPSFGSATSVGLVGTIQQTWGYSYFNSKTVTHYTVSLGGVVGFSSAEISSSTIKSDPEFKSYKTDVGGNKIFLPSTIFGAHLLLGRNNLGLSISAGYEYAIGPYSKGWIYQGRPWVGIGIITSLGMF